jgi:hypothetical protein
MAAVACCRFSHEPSPLFAVVSPDGLVKVHLISIMPFLPHVLVVHTVVEDVHNDTRASLTQAATCCVWPCGRSGNARVPQHWPALDLRGE